MAKICVIGGTELKGNVRVAGAKNAILPILAATLLTTEPIVLKDCPKLADVDNMLSILAHMGSTLLLGRRPAYDRLLRRR